MALLSAQPVPPPKDPAALAAAAADTKLQFGHILLDISNSVLPLERLGVTPSQKEGMSDEMETDIRSLGCELIQLAGRLLRLPQVAMATGCVLFQRFFYAKSFARNEFDVIAMGCACLASKIEEAPRRMRDIINVFLHIKQVRSGKPIQTVILDQNYVDLKNRVIKAERRVLKELGFCVHVKHPHKIIVVYLKWLELNANAELLQMSWNFMNDSLRTDVFVRHPPETIAVACIYLSARKLKLPLPRRPAWYEVLSVEEDDIRDCCYRMICLYNRSKPKQEELESAIEALRTKHDDARRVERERHNRLGPGGTPSASSPASRAGSPSGSGGGGGGQPAAETSREAPASGNGHAQENGRKHEGGGKDAHGRRSQDRSIVSRSRSRSPYDRKHGKHKKHKSERSRSASRDARGDGRARAADAHAGGKRRKKSRSRPRSTSPGGGGGGGSPHKRSKKTHKDKHHSQSRERGGGSNAHYDAGKAHGGGGGGGSSHNSKYNERYGSSDGGGGRGGNTRDNRADRKRIVYP